MTYARRILFISPQPYFQWRGSPIRVGFNLLALSELGMEVDLLTLPFGDERPIPGVRVIRVKNMFGLNNIPIGPSLWKALFAIRLFFAARRLIREMPYDVIHAVEDAGIIAVPLAGMSRAKLIFEKHSDPGSYRKGPFRNFIMWLYRQVEAFVIRKSDAVIATGPSLVEQARRLAPDKPCHHIFDIPSSLADADAARVSSIRQEWRPGGEEVVVLYVGSFAVYQGIDLLFDAIPRVCGRESRARFVIIGGDSREIEARRLQLHEKLCAQHVVFAGKIPPDDLPHYLSAADILLSPRISGTNTPLKLLDYLKSGRCILATDNQANRQILDDRSAFFVRSEAEEFAEGIIRLIGSPETRERLARGGASLVRDQFNYERFKLLLAEAYASGGSPLF